MLAETNRVGVTTNSVMARKLGLKYSTAHRILMVLTDLDLLRHDDLGHQFVLAAGVRQLSAGFHDDKLVDQIARPRMLEWTRKLGLPVLLVTEANNQLCVRASTDPNWSASGERHVAGNGLPATRSCEMTLFHAYRNREPVGTRAAALRHAGYICRVRRLQREVHVSVPVIVSGELMACLSMRGTLLYSARAAALQRWIVELQALAADIAYSMN